MEAAELRKGNWVMHNGEINQVLEIGKDWLRLSNNQLNTPIREVQPVILTEELLVEFVFENSHAEWWRKQFFTQEDADPIQWLAVNTVSKRAGVYSKEDAAGIFIGEYIEFVHQLQNVFRALSGTELLSPNPKTS